MMNRTLKTRLGIGLAGGLLAAPVLAAVASYANDVSPDVATTVRAQEDPGQSDSLGSKVGRSGSASFESDSLGSKVG